jgi:hypothetical protein
MTPRKSSIGGLLGHYERRAIKLPEFQRPYSWEKTQLAAFWADLTAFHERFKISPVSASYFLGPVVVIESQEEITILDGQQRLATATILLAVLRDLAREVNGTSPHPELDYFARDVQRELIEKKDTDPLVYSLTLSELDEPFFLQSIKLDPRNPVKPTLRSHQLIQAAYEYFINQARTMLIGKQALEQVIMLKSMRDALIRGMSLVAIVVEDEEHAYEIFEALNDRGLRLSVPDLVVNLLLKRCGNNTDRHAVRQTWNSSIQLLGKRDVARFLRHLWLSKYGDLKAVGLYSAIKDHLASNKVTSLDFAQACADSCEDYLRLLDVDKSLPKDVSRDVEGLVRYLSVHNSLPLLLAGYQCLSDTDFTRLVKTIVAIYLRHSLFGNQNPLELETAFYEAAREIRAQYSAKASSAKQFQAAKGILMKLNPSDALVQQQFEELFLSKSEASWVVLQLANAMQSKTKELGMDKANVEHIFPQNAGADWPNRQSLEPFVWHVGNLTILGKKINSKAQNKGFTTKCTEHYAKSEIKMTTELLKVTSWDEAAIRSRAKQLSDAVVELWK